MRTRPGNRVQSIVYDGADSVAVTTIGDYYEFIETTEQVGGQMLVTLAFKKYYYAGSVRLAIPLRFRFCPLRCTSGVSLRFGDFVREDSDNPLYLIGDHLGSTSLVIDTDGDVTARRSYYPFGVA